MMDVDRDFARSMRLTVASDHRSQKVQQMFVKVNTTDDRCDADNHGAINMVNEGCPQTAAPPDVGLDRNCGPQPDSAYFASTEKAVSYGVPKNHGR